MQRLLPRKYMDHFTVDIWILLVGSKGYKVLILAPKNIWKDFMCLSAKWFNSAFWLSGYKVDCILDSVYEKETVKFDGLN